MNNELGDCAIAGSIEEIRLANAMRGNPVPFTDEQALATYSAITGYTPDDPDTDHGTDVHELYEYRQQIGIADADGTPHKIIDYAGLTVGDWNEMLVALSLFEMVGIGISVPDYAQQQFADQQPWHLEIGRHQILGGHYVPIVGAPNRHHVQVYTWGATQLMTEDFYAVHNLVAVVALDAEMFAHGKSIDGIDFDKLAADLPQLNTGPVMTKAPDRPSRTPKRTESGEAAA